MKTSSLKCNVPILGKLPGRRIMFRTATLAVASILALLASSQAQVIVSDDFENTGGSENASMIESKAVWEASGNRNLFGVVTDPEGLNSGNVLTIGNGLGFSRFADTTVEVGSSLAFSLRFRSRDEDVTYPLPLRIGICENKDGVPDTGDTAGYWLSTGPGADKTSGISFEQNTDSLGGGSDGVGLGQGIRTGYDWLKPHRLMIKIVRPAVDLIEVHVQFDDEAEVILPDAKASVTQFNLIALRMANTAQSSVLIDDVKVELLKAAK